MTEYYDVPTETRGYPYRIMDGVKMYFTRTGRYSSFTNGDMSIPYALRYIFENIQEHGTSVSPDDIFIDIVDNVTGEIVREGPLLNIIPLNYIGRMYWYEDGIKIYPLDEHGYYATTADSEEGDIFNLVGATRWLIKSAVFLPRDDDFLMNVYVELPGKNSTKRFIDVLTNLLGNNPVSDDDKEPKEESTVEYDNDELENDLDEQSTGDEKHAYVLREDPTMALDWLDSEPGRTYVTLLDHMAVDEIPGITYDDAPSLFDYSKFYIIPVKGDNLTIKELFDFAYAQGISSRIAVEKFEQVAETVNIDKENK